MATSLASATVIARWPTSRVLRALALGATLAVVVAALAVQRELFGPRLLGQTPRLWGAVAAAALAVWWLAGWALPREAAPPEVTLPARTTVRRLAFGGLLAGSLALLTAGLALLYLDLTSPLGARLWLLGLIGLVATFAAREVPRPRLVPRQRSTADWLWLALAVATVAAAFALRLYRLEAIPASFNNDEGETADWGLNVLHQTLLWGQHVATPSSPFHSGWATNPLGGHYLHAVVMQVAGETIFGMRLTSAISGAIGVWLLYLLLWDYVRPWAAVGAALLMAVSHVHLFWSRTGLLQSLMTALATAMLWLMLRGLRSSGYLSFVLAGLLLGATQHLYQGARFLVPVVAFFFLYTAVADRQFVRRRWSHVLAMATSSAIVFAPLGFWYLAHPGELFTRTAAVFIFSNPDYLRGMYPGKDTLGVVIEQLRRSIEGLAFSGDGSLAFYPPRVPLVDPVVGAVLLVGILGFTFSLRRPERVLVGLWAWLTILIACTSTVDPPPMTRLILMVPALFFVVGVVLDRLGRLAEQAAGRRGLVALALPLVVALGYAAVWNYHVFFVAYPRDFPTGVWTAAGNLARTLGPSSKTYMVGPPELYFLNSTVRFLTRGLAGDDLPEKDIPVRERGYRDGLFIVSPALPNALARLRAAYPNGQLQEHRDSRGNLLFTAYRVDAATLNAAAGPDAPYRQYDLRFGMKGKGFGQFENGRALAVDAQGRIYVADVGNGRIDVFDAMGRPIATLGKPGTGDGEFRQVWG
ncbi:MAG: glycosyltransferase family 39 protein, partial [Chloroflexi bacterium]|nr:glycosyltransferase family 39 protein [Chloroflexota bacterium]